VRHRKIAVAAILSGMALDQRSLVTVLEPFSAVVGEMIDDAVWQWAPRVE
jgi:hypothetical protein